MSQINRGRKTKDLLERMRHLPRKMILLHGHDNVVEFVIHELCNKNCFNIPKAAYFVDNPDFNCIKGIAGFSAEDEYTKDGDIWVAHNDFSDHMRNAGFNKKVRTFEKESYRKKGASDDHIVEEIASSLELKNPNYHAWDLKHANHGIFIYEKDAHHDAHEYLLDSLSLLGFCPVF